MMEIEQRAKNALLGLAIGDAVGWSAMYHRALLLPPWTRRVRRTIEASCENDGVLAQAYPFSLNRDASVFLPGPTDDTEWAAFSASLLLESNGASMRDVTLNAWKKLANGSDLVRGKASVHAALKNLRKGLLPPQTGHDNPSYFDDGAVTRAVPIGIANAGNPDAAARAAQYDASITNGEDGVYAAKAMAVAVALACVGAHYDEVLRTALSQFPGGSWIDRNAGAIRTLTSRGSSLSSSVVELSEQLVNREYNSGSVAPETFVMALGILKLTEGNFEEGLMASTLVPKCAESVPAFVGAIAGALASTPVATLYWIQRLSVLKGICIPGYKDKDFIKIVDELASKTAANADSKK